MAGISLPHTKLRNLLACIACTILVGCGSMSAVSTHRDASGSMRERAERAKIDRLIARHAMAEGVPVQLARAVVRTESNYRVKARGRAGEVGLMQIKPATARSIGYRGSTSGLYNPATNIKWGMKYLGQARRLAGGSTCGTAMRYNGGLATRRLTASTSSYCGKVKRNMRR